MSDDPARPGEETPGAPGPSGADLARAALAQAKADARGVGSGDRQPSDRGGDRRGDRRGGGSGAGSRPPASRDPEPFGAAIRRLLAERGWQTRAAVAGVMARWDAVVGPEVAAHTRPERFADGELVVVADSTAWATQLRLLARPLVARINAELGPGTVRSVKVLGPGAPNWSAGPRRVPGRGPRDTYG